MYPTVSTHHASIHRFSRSVLLALAATLALALAARPAGAQGLLIVSLGDSYASGEGAPDTPATGCNAAGPNVLLTSVPCATQPVWSASPPGDPLAASDGVCDRSARAGVRQAADSLRLRSSVPVEFGSFAGSGARIADVTSRRQHPSVPAQIDAVQQRFGRRRIDALVISIGGNDVGFADLVTRCVVLPRCDQHPDILWGQNNVERLASDLGVRYDELADALLRLNVARVLITEYPIPLFDEAGSLCAGRPAGDPLAGVGREEASWAAGTAIPRMNRAIREAVARHAAKGWRYVGGVVGGFSRNGWCASMPFLNTVGASLRVEGKSAGAAHPNAAGQTVYRNAILAELRLLLPPTRPAIAALRTSTVGGRTEAFPGDSIRIAWNPAGGLVSSYQVAFRPAGYADRFDPPPGPPQDRAFAAPEDPLLGPGGWSLVRGLPRDRFTFAHHVQRGTYFYAVRSCTVFACSAWSDAVRVSNVAASPAPPAAVRLVRVAQGVVTVDWEDVGGWPGTRYQVAWREAPGAPWQSAWLRSDSARIIRRIAGAGPADFYVRQRGSAICTQTGCEPSRTSAWSTGLRVRTRPPSFVPTLSAVGDSTVRWALPLNADHAAFQIAWTGSGTSYAYATLPPFQLRYTFRSPARYTSASGPAIVTVRACNEAGCAGWASPIFWRSALVPVRYDPLASAPLPEGLSAPAAPGPPPPYNLP